jgi:hypothetical protein
MSMWLGLLDAVPGPISGPDAQKAAESELRRAKYHRDDEGLLTRVLNWIGRRLDSLNVNAPASLATWAVLLLLAGMIVFALIRAGRPGRQTRAAGAGDLLAPQAAVDHRRVAAELQAQGRLADALREWLRATVQTIEERGVLDPLPGRTGARVAREAGAAMPAVASSLNAAVDAFDAVWFGQRQATLTDVHLARQVADDVRGARIEHRLSDDFGYAVPR